MDLLLKYFNSLTDLQTAQFEQLLSLYKDWNAKINVISRKDIDNLYLHHVLHSLSIAKLVQFNPGAEILDLGTGGGFPGIPLAILFPDTHFLLIDGTRKKIKVVNAVAESISLKNIKAKQLRIEEHRQKHDFIVSRAVAKMDKLVSWTKKNIKKKEAHVFPNGLIVLKGGMVYEEIENLPRGTYSEVFPISEFFEEPYFEEKFLVYVQG
ncbi:MAG: 16S rRNA (guanine(527)-N(7))-methyltransferase RsmG [Bacteroidia bacterium]|nr:16S rRNA (guanine(527)-N(7))-methyltransferase RsmG [Bacteroidia bacterium]